MFEGLKKKFSTFIGTLSGKEQERIEEESVSESKEKIREIEESGKEIGEKNPTGRDSASTPTSGA